MDIFRSVVPTFQHPRHRSQSPVISDNSLRWSAAYLWQNVVLLRPFHKSKEMKITGSQVRADDGGWSNTSKRKRFRRLFVAAAVCDRALSWRRTMPDDNIPSLVMNKGIELQQALHIWRETIVLGMFTGSLRAQNWHVLCVAIDGHTRDIAQHICAKMHLNLTVVLISRPIGPWKKNSPRIIFIHGWFVIAPEIATSLANNAPVNTVE